ncbi:serine protease snake-like [Ischnura elegans]|uniref:serine protease snake-like n=1 Tax=Ischnura elegans TaxID=197161 RepID=UPI001ED8899C|nr:serine protease snake-like [Ischnura elegans]
MHRRMKTGDITEAIFPHSPRTYACIVLAAHLLAACSAEFYPGKRVKKPYTQYRRPMLVRNEDKGQGDKCIDSRERLGECTPLDQCPRALEELKKGVKPVHCGFDGILPIYQYHFNFTECEEYNKICPELFAIDGGIPALPSEFPHMAAVGYGAKSNIQWKCGGSLISENFILTAAHCLHGGKDGPPQWVLLGTLTLVKNETFLGESGQIHGVLRRIQHPEYKPPAKYNDVALLEIGPAFTRNPNSVLSKELHPACLATEDSYQWRSFVATGWGRVGFGGERSNELLKVELDVFDEAKCNKTFEVEIRTTNQLMRGIDSTMLCAGILSGGKDTCQGDSGGPLQFELKTECQYEIWGITSFGKVCSFANSPSVYMRVSAYVKWIEDIVWAT